MRELIVFTVSGLTTGGIYAITASGLTLTYATTGVFNFAHGALGMIAAFAYWQLRFAWHLPTMVAFAVVLLVAAPLAGLLIELAVMRRLVSATESTKLVVTVGLMLGLVSLALWVWNPATARSVRPLWSAKVVHWGLVRVSYNDLTVLAVALAVSTGLWALLHRTRAGVAMRAVVDDADLAALSGASPRYASQLAWVVGTMLAALAGILVAPKLSLSPLPLTLLIVNAYAAAVIGRLRNLPMTYVGALVLGLANDLAVGYVPKIDTGQQYVRGFVGVTPVVVLLVALLVGRPRTADSRRPRRTLDRTPLPTWGGTGAFAAGIVAVTTVLATVLSAGDLFNVTKVWGLAIVALSAVPLMGYGGRLSLCQLSLAAVGAVVAAHLGGGGNPIALVAAPLAAAAVGVIIALPTRRLSGIYLALSTAAFAVALDRWIFALPAFTVLGHRFTIFHTGSLTLQRPRLGPVDLASDRAFLIAGSLVFAGAAAAVIAVRRSRFGQRLLAQRDSPAAAASVGVDVGNVTLAVFVLSAAIAGFGGAWYGMALRSAAAGQFELVAGVSLLLAVVVGGVRSVGSAVFAGAVLGGPTITNLFPHLSQLTSISIALSAVALGTNPNGILADRLRPRAERVLQHPALLAAAAVSLAGLWVARLVGAIDNWAWALASAVVAGALLCLEGYRAGARRLASTAPLEVARGAA